MPIIQQTYRRDRLFPVVLPLDLRLGQLGEGALDTVGDVLDLGSLSNVNRLQVGDSFYFISDENELSGNSYAEAVEVNDEVFLIESISGRNVTLDHEWAIELNAEDKFFEFKVLRRIPQSNFTFPRTLQTNFSGSTVGFYVNGVSTTKTLTNPSGQQTLLTWSGGTILFVPLGGGRYRCEPRITVDAHIEVIVPDSSEDVELRLSNLGVLEDLPRWAVGTALEDFVPFLVGRLSTYERILGLCYIEGKKGLEARIATAKPASPQIQAGSEQELLIHVVTGVDEAPFQFEGATVYMESRDLQTGELKTPLQAEQVSPGLVRVVIPSGTFSAGSVRSQLAIYVGSVTNDVVRTSAFIIQVLS